MYETVELLPPEELELLVVLVAVISSLGRVNSTVDVVSL